MSRNAFIFDYLWITPVDNYLAPTFQQYRSPMGHVPIWRTLQLPLLPVCIRRRWRLFLMIESFRHPFHFVPTTPRFDVVGLHFKSNVAGNTPKFNHGDSIGLIMHTLITSHSQHCNVFTFGGRLWVTIRSICLVTFAHLRHGNLMYSCDSDCGDIV